MRRQEKYTRASKSIFRKDYEVRIEATHKQNTQQIPIRTSNLYYVPYRLERVGSLKRPIGLKEQGFLRVEATSLSEAVKKAGEYIDRPHYIYKNWITHG